VVERGEAGEERLGARRESLRVRGRDAPTPGGHAGKRAPAKRRGRAPTPHAAGRRPGQRIGDERSGADTTREEPFGLKLRERVVDGIARDAPVHGELARGRQPRAARKAALDDRGEAGLVDLIAQSAVGGDRAGDQRDRDARGDARHGTFELAQQATRKWPLR